MIRLLNLLAVIGLVASAGYAYSIKYDTLYQAALVSKLKSQLHKERQAVAVLRAEWQLLTRPDRLQAAVERHLALEPIGTAHLARLADLPARPDRGDEIARLLATTATPKDTGARDAAKDKGAKDKDRAAAARGPDEPRTTGSTTTRTVSTRAPTAPR